MSLIKKIGTMFMAGAMVIGLGATGVKAAPETGSITVDSPVVGATYKVYKVFDMVTDDAVTSFSYTIDEDNPFYGAVVAYFNANKGLTLTRIADSDPAKYNVAVDESVFNAQDFGKAMQAVLETGSPAVTADADKGIVEKAAGTAITEAGSKTVGVNDSALIKFAELDLGYYLVNPTYPSASYGTVTLGTTQFTVADLVTGEDGKPAKPLQLTEDGQGKVDAYAEATVDDDYVEKYLTDNHITTNKDGSPLDAAGKAEYKQDLIAAMKTDAAAKVLDAFATSLAAHESDINVKDPILVFLDSSQPNAVIYEKNETVKWDVPVNPTADVNPDLPDHGEPNGGKNIVIQEDPAYYADWSEAAIGDSVHYQLRVNAMNFIRTGDNDATIEQVKEYFLADYQSGHMHYDKTHGLKVTVYAGNDNNDSQNGRENVTKDKDGNHVEYLDYSDYTDVFFKNTTEEDAETKPENIFDPNKGIMVPWVKVSEKNADLDPAYPIYTTTKVPTGNFFKPTVDEAANYVVDDEGYALDENNNRIPLYDTYYVYSLYNSDVTIVVDYWMILDDDAIVDEPGNKNYAQYAWNPVDNEDGEGNPKQPTPPSDDDEPSQYSTVDEATVYTFALAWVKIDNKGNELAGAKFQLPFYVFDTKDGDSYVYAGTEAGEGKTNEVTTTADSAVITIKGVKQGVYSITEIEAPEGFNPLTAPFTVEAKKSGNGVTTKTETTVYLDAQGNVTNETTTTTVTYETDDDNNADNVPVYQFDPIVNNKGTELPGTGGIGTKMFYAIGGILVAVAGVLLVSRKRMLN